MKITDSDIDLMNTYGLTESAITYLKIAKMELPCSRKQFRVEVVDYITEFTFQMLTKQLAEKGIINNPRNTTEIMDLTEKGWEIANQTGKGQTWERWYSQNEYNKLEMLLRSGSIRTVQKKQFRFYYCRAK